MYRSPSAGRTSSFRLWLASATVLLAGRHWLFAQTNAPVTPDFQAWNWHAQNTVVLQATPPFPAAYSGPNSLNRGGETRETVSLDLIAGVRLWRGAEAHVDGLMWQGFGLSKALGVDGFPNGEAFRLGTDIPNVNLCRVFVRQTIGLGGESEPVADDALHLAGRQEVERVTITLGRMNVKDIFDNSTYANDPRTQFMNWALMANEAWDFPADSLGYMTGVAVELNQPRWAARYGFFQMPRVANGTALDLRLLDAWGMVAESEFRHAIRDHPGAVRFLAFLNQAHMGSYAATLADPSLGMDITKTRDYRQKFGFGLNIEQEIVKNVGVFTRLGWSDGRNEAWAFSDVDRTVTLGISLKGEAWGRAEDTFGLAGVLNGLSAVHSEFFGAGGLGILAGDGRLAYGWEQVLETYYDCQLWKTLHLSFDYQFVNHPAFNRDRGSVYVLGARVHWEF
jgi:high affinity Mn2+ porin